MKTKLYCFLFLLALLAGVNQAAAQGTTAFTYQGQLHDGSTNANGTYTMVFALYDSVSTGNQVGTASTNSLALANGLFTVNLDFGTGAFGGNARWLDITVIKDSTTERLSPRVQILPSPYALYAGNAGSLSSGSWSAGVGNLQTDKDGIVSNVFLMYANGALVMGMSTNGIAMGNDLHIDGSLNVNSNISLQGGLSLGNNFIGFAGGDSIFSDDRGGIQINGDLSVNGNVSGAIPQLQVFNSSGTFVVPTNVAKVMVELWGGGGGGGGGSMGYSSGAGGGGGGGGGGSYGKDTISVAPGGSMAVTVGSGGSAGAGSVVTFGSGSTGGNGGNSSIGSLYVQGGFGGTGGTTTGGNYAIEGTGGSGGGNGPARISLSGQTGQSGGNNGASGSFPNGGNGGNAAGAGAFANPGGDLSPGGGASGGFGGSSNLQPGANGQTGGAGRVIIWW